MVYTLLKRYESTSQPGVYYKVSKDEHGNLSCNCPGWTRHTKDDGSRNCKHISQYVSEKHSHRDDTEVANDKIRDSIRKIVLKGGKKGRSTVEIETEVDAYMDMLKIG